MQLIAAVAGSIVRRTFIPPLLMAYLSSSLASSEDLSRKHTSPHRCGAMISNLEQDQDKTNARHSFSRSM